jgi:hypothetical protein
MLHFDTNITRDKDITIKNINTSKSQGKYSYKLSLLVSQGDTESSLKMSIRPAENHTIVITRLGVKSKYSDKFIQQIKSFIRILVAILYNTDHSVCFV